MQSKELPKNRKGARMIIRFLLRNIYSVLFVIFMVLNFNILRVWFPHAMTRNLPLLAWVAAHIYLYYAYIAPAEDRKNNANKEE
jgi:hypothetical protein